MSKLTRRNAAADCRLPVEYVTVSARTRSKAAPSNDSVANGIMFVNNPIAALGKL
jgi:hypothetical protein